MNFNKVILGLAFFFVYVALMGNNAACQDLVKTKGAKGAPHSSPSASYATGKGSPLKEEADGDVQAALEELKLLTADASKKSQVNRNLLVGTTLVNTALLLVVSGLIGYSMREKKEDKGENGSCNKAADGEN